MWFPFLQSVYKQVFMRLVLLFLHLNIYHEYYMMNIIWMYYKIDGTALIVDEESDGVACDVTNDSQ